MFRLRSTGDERRNWPQLRLGHPVDLGEPDTHVEENEI